MHMELLRAHMKLLREHVKVKLLHVHMKRITCTREVITCTSKKKFLFFFSTVPLGAPYRHVSKMYINCNWFGGALACK